MHRCLVTMAAAFVLCTNSLCGQDYVNSELPFHAVTVDSQGKVLAWYQPDKNLGYDQVLHLGWDFLEHHAPVDPKTGLKVYLINSVFDANTGLGTYWQHNPASVYGQFVDSLIPWYAYSGDKEASSVVRSMLDYQLAHGTTPMDWEWASVPFATSCGNDTEYGKCLRDTPRSFYGGIETDKVGELGTGYVLFYELTGDRKYLAAGIHCADALAKHVQPGNETHTPWPFRLDAKTGTVIGESEYGGMVVANVRLFAELIRIHEGSVAQYESSKKMAWDWLRKYPMQNNRWVGYFEDVPRRPENVNQASPTMTAYYILAQADPAKVDPQWIGDVGHLLDWVRKHFGRGPYFGAWGIDEQGEPPEYVGCCSRAGLASDTSRWAAVNALYYERTRDAQSREDAYRSLNYSTYFASGEGKIACCGMDYHDPAYWWDDGYGDYLRNLQWAMGAIPQFAPKGQDHLLRSTSVVRTVEYGNKSVQYTTFDAESTETLRLSYSPAHVQADGEALKVAADAAANGYTVTPLGGGDYLVLIRHLSGKQIRVTG